MCELSHCSGQVLYPEFITFISGVAQWVALNLQSLVLTSLGGARLALLSQLVTSEVTRHSGEGRSVGESSEVGRDPWAIDWFYMFGS